MSEELEKDLLEENVTESAVEEPVEPTVVIKGEKYGNKETKEILVFCFSIAKAFKDSLDDDGKLTVMDSAKFFSVLPNLGPALDGITKLPKEIADLNQAEIKDIVIFAKAHLAGMFTDDEDLKEKIEKGFALAIALTEFIATFFKK